MLSFPNFVLSFLETTTIFWPPSQLRHREVFDIDILHLHKTFNNMCTRHKKKQTHCQNNLKVLVYVIVHVIVMHYKNLMYLSQQKLTSVKRQQSIESLVKMRILHIIIKMYLVHQHIQTRCTVLQTQASIRKYGIL